MTTARHYLFGDWMEGELNEQRAAQLLKEAQARVGSLQNLSIYQIVSLLEEAGQTLIDPRGGFSPSALKIIPSQTGWSPPMVEIALRSLKDVLNKNYLLKKIEEELGSVDALEHWIPNRQRNLMLHAAPLGIVFHVASGNSFLTGVLSLVEGMLSRNINIVKMSSSETYSSLLFAQALKEVAPDSPLTHSFAIIQFQGGSQKIEQTFKRGVNGIVLWGDAELVSAYRRDLPAHVSLIEFGPKVSFAVASSEGLHHPHEAKRALSALAMNLSLWDGEACSSPQVLYFINCDDLPVNESLQFLAGELNGLSQEIPPRKLSEDEAVEIHKERELATFRAVQGKGAVVTSENLDWSILSDSDPTFRFSPLHRTLLVKRVKNMAELLSATTFVLPYVQTVGVLASREESAELSQAFLNRGVARIISLAKMSGGIPGEPHDGFFSLTRLTRWVTNDSEHEARGISSAVKKKFTRLLLNINNSPFYKARLNAHPLKALSDLKNFPILEKEQIRAELPARGAGLLCQPMEGALYLKTGGTMGTPKTAVYTYKEFIRDMECGAKGLRTLGLVPGTKVANLFLAGSLYGSFISFFRIGEMLELQQFPLTASAPAEEIISCIREFNISVIMGLPSPLLSLIFSHPKDFRSFSLDMLLYGGEHLLENNRRRLQEEIGIKKIHSLGYGSVDTGAIGYQCLFSTGSIHHLHSDHQWMEIVDLETGESLSEEGEIGEILLTTLDRELAPLVRYRIGDCARWIREECPCGDSTPRFELLGRSDDMVVVGMMHLLHREIQEILAPFPQIVSPAQIVVDYKNGQDHVSIRCEISEQGEKSLDPQALRRHILNQHRPLRERLEEKLLADVIVILCQSGTLERNPRSGKQKLIIDNRK